jgi:hypothetical protein
MEILLLSWGIAVSGLALAFLLDERPSRDHAAAGLAAKQAAKRIMAAKQAAAAKRKIFSTTGVVRMICRNSGMEKIG